MNDSVPSATWTGSSDLLGPGRKGILIRTTFTNLNGRSYQDLVAFAPESEWEALSCASSDKDQKEAGLDVL